MSNPDILILDETNPGKEAEVIVTETQPEDRTVELSDGKIRVNLLYPVTYKIKPATGLGAEREETLSSLTLRRPNGGDMTASQKFRDQWEQTKVLISRLGGIQAQLIDRMDLDDIIICGEVIERFLPSAQKPGKPT